MSTMSTIANGRGEALADALRAEFGGMLAARILEAEAVDFLWGERVAERYLGQHFGDGIDEDEGFTELSRMLVLSPFAGAWHVAACLVDGDAEAVELLWKQPFGSRDEAERSFVLAR